MPVGWRPLWKFCIWLKSTAAAFLSLPHCCSFLLTFLSNLTSSSIVFLLFAHIPHLLSVAWLLSVLLLSLSVHVDRKTVDWQHEKCEVSELVSPWCFSVWITRHFEGQAVCHFTHFQLFVCHLTLYILWVLEMQETTAADFCHVTVDRWPAVWFSWGSNNWGRRHQPCFGVKSEHDENIK